MFLFLFKRFKVQTMFPHLFRIYQNTVFINAKEIAKEDVKKTSRKYKHITLF